MTKKLSYILIVLFIFFKIPEIYKNFKLQNTISKTTSLRRLSGEEISFPIENQKMIIVFWDSDCETCKIELNRFNKLMAQGQIKSNELLAINMSESQEIVNNFLNKNSYQFLIALDESGSAANSFEVTQTPTVIFLDEKAKIHWMTSGISPTLENRVNQFLKN